jgi:hypothetical protein
MRGSTPTSARSQIELPKVTVTKGLSSILLTNEMALASGREDEALKVVCERELSAISAPDGRHRFVAPLEAPLHIVR